jgi:hypothetical protein
MVEDAFSRKLNEDAASIKIEASLKVPSEVVQEKVLPRLAKRATPAPCAPPRWAPFRSAELRPLQPRPNMIRDF